MPFHFFRFSSLSGNPVEEAFMLKLEKVSEVKTNNFWTEWDAMTLAPSGISQVDLHPFIEEHVGVRPQHFRQGHLPHFRVWRVQPLVRETLSIIRRRASVRDKMSWIHVTKVHHDRRKFVRVIVIIQTGHLHAVRLGEPLDLGVCTTRYGWLTTDRGDCRLDTQSVHCGSRRVIECFEQVHRSRVWAGHGGAGGWRLLSVSAKRLKYLTSNTSISETFWYLLK